MNPPKRLLATTLPAQAHSTPFFIQRFEGRKHAISHGAHRHRFFELILIEEGVGSQSLEGKITPVKKGDIFVISPGESHDPDGLDSTTHWIAAFDASFISRKSQSDSVLYSGLPGEIVLLGFARPETSGPAQFHLPDHQLKNWVSLFRQSEEELRGKKLGYIECTQALLSLVLIDLARLTAPQMPYPRGESRSLLAAFFATLEQSFKKPTDLQKISKVLKLSPSHLTDLVRKETGKTVMEWLRRRRISEAKFLLQESDRSVKEIAFEAGYKDSNLMIRHFKQETGVSPKAWKNALTT